ncbi:thiol oxidoreductase [Haematospirillum jordaniae]|uniref:di-heme oxidoreductase family protein n=1 Tax=Haematospirillum jordaniae TaxID=1549855 RepID=UPI00143341D9|nr:di-heme oxidoredictase family protein [Haematospirillum jordaniae]NKD85185.1 thiol oxidoreductase [Haematospirillum jordaniae]
MLRRLYSLFTALALPFLCTGSALAAEPRPDQGEQRSLDRRAFSRFLPGLSADEKMGAAVGNGFFKRLWVSSPSSTQASDGLGPLFNARACSGCHARNGRGRPPDPDNGYEHSPSFFLRLSIPPQTAQDEHDRQSGRLSVIGDPTYGTQLQSAAVPGLKAEGRVGVTWTEETVTLAGGERVSLRHPTWSARDLAYGPLSPQIMISPRMTPQLPGLGLLEAVPDTTLLNLADPDDRDNDGISGRTNRVWSAREHAMRIGRFGWKAGQPTLDDQNQSAFNGDIGLSTPLFPQAHGDCTAAQPSCLAAPHGNSVQFDSLEAPKAVTDSVLLFVRALAPPSRRNRTDPAVMAGEQLFSQIGCSGCHRPHLRTGSSPYPWLAHQDIAPFTDLLLHDMGDDLADLRPEALASGHEWRTPPLWGLGMTKAVSGAESYLHDGRARTLTEAVLWHGGEARRAREAFRELPAKDRAALLDFLRSL